MRVIQNGAAADADAGQFHCAEVAFTIGTLKIQALFIRLNDVHLFARALADVADENPSCARVIGHPMRAAQAEAEKFFEDIRLTVEYVGLAHKRDCHWEYSNAPCVH